MRLYGTTLIEWMSEWILGRVSGIPRRFCRADDIITNLAKERESLGSRSSNTLPNLIITSLYVDYIHHLQELFPQNQMIIAEHSDNGIQRDGQKVAAAA